MIKKSKITKEKRQNATGKKPGTVKVFGFTIIELLVSVVIFGIVMSLVLGSVWTMVKTREQATRFRNLQQELHFGMMKMADMIRAYGVDYAQHQAEGVSLDAQTQHLILGHRVWGSEPLRLKINIGSDGDDTPAHININDVPLFSDRVQLKADEEGQIISYFQVVPEVDPFKNYGTAESQLQPRVKIYLVLQDRQYPNLEIPIQTTISSRKYSP